jgi:hypothetical protein
VDSILRRLCKGELLHKPRRHTFAEHLKFLETLAGVGVPDADDRFSDATEVRDEHAVDDVHQVSIEQDVAWDAGSSDHVKVDIWFVRPKDSGRESGYVVFYMNVLYGPSTSG